MASKKPKPTITDRLISVLSPSMATKRYQDRLEFSACCTDPQIREGRPIGGNEWKRHRNGAQANRERRDTRARIEDLFEESEVVSSICRDLETYVAPTGYEPSTERNDWNRRISDFIERFDCECDYKGMTSFFEMLALCEVEKARSGDVGLAAIDPDGTKRDKRYLPIQAIPGCRIGHPTVHDPNDPKYWPDGFAEESKVPGIYRNGLEFADGKAVRAHIWKYVEVPKKNGHLQSEHEWVYDTSFEFRKSFWFLSDPRFIDQERPRSEFAQCIDKLTSVICTLKSTASRLEFFARLAGFLKGGDGDVSTGLPGAVLTGGSSDSCEHCHGEGCSHCGPKVIEMAESLEIWGIPEGKEFDPSKFDLNAEMLLAVIEALLESAAFCVHLPSSFVSLRRSSRGAQGTIERGDQQKAQREFMRRRRKLVKRTAKPIIQAALLWGKQNGDAMLKGIPDEQLILGDFIFPPDISVDPGRDGKQLLAERKAGLLPDALYYQKFERRPQQIHSLKLKQLEQLIEDTRMASGVADWNPTPEAVARYLDDRGLGEDPAENPPEAPADIDTEDGPV